MSLSIKNHRLLDGANPVDFVATPNKGGKIQPLYLMLHYTAGLKASGAIDWFQKPVAEASAHLVIDRDGTITQMVDFNLRAWHAGKSEYNGLTGMNAYSIGIEIVNGGKLKKNETGKWRTWSGEVVPPEEVTVATHKHESHPAGWHLYTAKQIETTVEAGIALRKQYNLIEVLGHDDVSPNRKVDTGPAFPMISVAGKIMGREK